MSKEIRETLEIDNFLSISHLKWEFARFNIITGDMGAGKSLCIKLLKFFEDIIPNFLVLPYELILKNLDTKRFFSHLAVEFNSIFTFLTTDPNKRPAFKINYTFSYNEVTFDVTITGKDETDISFESVYLRNMLKEWFEYSQTSISENNVTPDGFSEAKKFLYNEVLKKFGGYFPLATTFVPASRAALAFSSNHTDHYLKEYKELMDVLPQFKSRNMDIINTILKAKIKIEDSYSLYLESDDGRKVPIAKASSGQQEIIYVLMLLDKLGNFYYTYGKHHSIFIEEPEAHLFPLEQKQSIEFITRIFDHLKDNGNPVRFFITTHSPYVLNVINNMMRKGSIIKQNTKQKDVINDKIEFPSLFIEDVSAVFINEDGTITDMIDQNEEQILPEKIRDISFSINNDINRLDALQDELNQASQEN